MKEHKIYLDKLRLVAAYCVVLMHTAASGLRHNVSMRPGWIGLAAISSFTFCAVPLFFMMSGYLLFRSDVDPAVVLKKRIPRLLIPLLFWSLMHIALNAFALNNRSLRFFIDGIIQALQKPANISFWFMYSLMGMYLIAPLLALVLKSPNKRLHNYVIGIIVVLKLLTLVEILYPAFYGKYLSFNVMQSINVFDGHLCSFILGWYLGKTEKRIPSLLIFIAAIIDYGIILKGTLSRSMASGSYIQDFQTQNAFFEVFLAVCIFLLVKNIKFNKYGKANELLRRLAPYSFCVYLSHNLFLRLYTDYFKAMPVSLPGILALSLAVYLLGILIGELFSHILVLRYLILGIHK